MPRLEVVEVVLVQCNLVDNQYQQKPEGLYPFTPNKSYAYLLIVEPSNLVFLKTCNTEFCLLKNRNDVLFYWNKNEKIC